MWYPFSSKGQTINHNNQQQAQMLVQRQGELQYTVYKDVENFLGILVESNTVCSILDKDDPLINIHINRLIAQLNLSKSIHYDTQNTAEDNRNNDQLSGLKLEALNIIQQYLQVYKIQIDNRIEQYFKDYKDVLNKRQDSLSITKLIPTNRINNLQEQQIANLLNSMNSVDQDYQNMRNGQQYKLDKNQLFKRIDDRIEVAQAKLKGYKQSSSQNQKQKNSKQASQEEQDQFQDLSLSTESIQIINNLIQISENKSVQSNIEEVCEVIRNIQSQDLRKQPSNHNQKYRLEQNDFLNRVFKDIQAILKTLSDQKKAQTMVSKIQEYFQQKSKPSAQDWRDNFERKDIETIQVYIANKQMK